MRVRTRNRHSPLKFPSKDLLALGLEGSANKLGSGIVKHSSDGTSAILSNVRHTYNPPPGEGFLPRDTAAHHRTWAAKVIKESVEKAGIRMRDLDCICFTKGMRSVKTACFQYFPSFRARYGCSFTISSARRKNTCPSLQQAACCREPLCRT